MIEAYSVADDIQTDNRNVRELYRESLNSEIRADLDRRRTYATCIFMNLTHDFNKSSAIRSCNAFLARQSFLVGRRRYDRRGSVGAHKYEHVFHADDLSEVVDLLHSEGYTVFAVDNVIEMRPSSIWDVALPEKSAFLFGEERRGLTEEEWGMCDGMLYVEMGGSTRSLNVACATSVVLAEYSRRHRNVSPVPPSLTHAHE